MDELDLTRARWRKSSRSSANGQCVEVAHLDTGTTWRKSGRSSANGACVEVARLSRAVAVRDSKDPAGPKLIVSSAAWRAFTRAIKDAALA